MIFLAPLQGLFLFQIKKWKIYINDFYKKIKFLKSIPIGSIVELTASIKHSDAIRVVIEIAGYYESKTTEGKALSITALFTFAAVNEKNKPIKIQTTQLQIV